MRFRTAIGSGAIALASVVALGCDDDTTGPVIGSVVLQPAADTLTVSETLQLQATVLSTQGDTLDKPVVFTSSDDDVASVSSTGLVMAEGPGTATITATSNGRSDTSTIHVRTAASIAIDPTDVTLTVGDTLTLSVTVLDADSVPVSSPVISFTSSDTTVATVGANGLVTAVAEGGTVITAETEGLTAQTDVTVEAVPVGAVILTPASLTIAVADTSRLTVTVQDTLGAVIPGAVVGFSSQDSLVARVDGTGLVTGVAVGATGIIAESGGVADTTAVTVQ